MFRFAMAGQGVVEATIRREVCEDMILRPKIQKVRRGKTIQIGFVIRHLALENAEQLPRIGIRQRPYHHSINNAEDRNSRPNSQPKGQNDRREESSILRKAAQCLAKFAEVHKFTHSADATM